MEIRKNIQFCIDSPGFGGSEINAMKLCLFLKKFHDVHLLLSESIHENILQFADENSFPYTFYSYTNKFSISVKGLNKLWNVTSNQCIFIIWSHHLDSNRWLQLMLALRNRKFIVVEMLLPTDYSVLNRSRLTRPIKNFVSSKALSSIICAYSQVDEYRKHFNCNNITVIPNTRPVSAIKNRVSLLRKRNQRAYSGLTITCIGRFTEQKNQESLIKAFSLISKNKDIRLVLVGSGECYEQLYTLVTDLKLDNVVFTGHLIDVYPILAETDIFVLPSLYEGLAGALLEAMISGAACIATDIPGNNELIINDETGLLVPVKNHIALAEAIQFLIDNPDKRSLYASNAYSLVLNNYDESIEFQKWNDLLKSV